MAEDARDEGVKHAAFMQGLGAEGRQHAGEMIGRSVSQYIVSSTSTHDAGASQLLGGVAPAMASSRQGGAATAQHRCECGSHFKSPHALKIHQARSKKHMGAGGFAAGAAAPRGALAEGGDGPSEEDSLRLAQRESAADARAARASARGAGGADRAKRARGLTGAALAGKAPQESNDGGTSSANAAGKAAQQSKDVATSSANEAGKATQESKDGGTSPGKAAQESKDGGTSSANEAGTAAQESKDGGTSPGKAASSDGGAWRARAPSSDGGGLQGKALSSGEADFEREDARESENVSPQKFSNGPVGRWSICPQDSSKRRFSPLAFSPLAFSAPGSPPAVSGKSSHGPLPPAFAPV